MTNVTTPSNTEAAKAEPVFDDPIGITDPPIDELLDKVSSKYALVLSLIHISEPTRPY